MATVQTDDNERKEHAQDAHSEQRHSNGQSIAHALRGKLEANRQQCQHEQSFLEIDLKQFALHPEWYTQEKIDGIRTRHREVREAYDQVRTDLATLDEQCLHAAEETEAEENDRVMREERPVDAPYPSPATKKANPWTRAKPAPVFLAEEDKEFVGLAKDIVAPGAITLIDAPKGIGKTQVIHPLAIALAMGGVFRGEQLQPVKVLLLDRENPVSVVRKRLRAWGAAVAENLHVLTRQDAPDLKDRQIWAQFPVEQYDVLFIDSVGASTEGITEKEGKQTSEVLATLLDLAHRDIAIILLQNTEKTGTNIRGRGEWTDRVDIQYEVRDATSFIPSGKRPWWLELPIDGAANWAERAARRKGKIDFRLAFVPAKFRLAAEPDPFCVEINLPEREPWTLRDVTDALVQAGEAAVHKAEQQKTETLEKAATALAEVVKDRAASGDPVLKIEAQEFLCSEQQLSQKAARSLLADREDILWCTKNLPAGKGKGTPKGLFPISGTATENPEQPSKDPSGSPYESKASEAPYSVGSMNTANQVKDSLEPLKKGQSEGGFTWLAEKSGATEKTAQKAASNEAHRDPFYSVAEDSETEAATEKPPKNPPYEDEV